MKEHQLGLNTVSLRGNFLEIVDGVAAAGFQNIEFRLAGVKGFLQTHEIGALKTVLRERGLKCIGGFEGNLQAFSDAETQAANQAQILENARLLAELGDGTPQNLVVGTDSKTIGTLENPLERYAQVVGEIARKIAPMNVNLLIEFNWGAVKTLPLAAQIARQSGAANAGVLFDPAHFYCTPTKSEDLTPENVATIKHVHLNTMRRQPAELSNANSDRLLPDDPGGALDLKSLFGTLENHGYNGYFSIEMFSEALWAMSPAQAARRMFESRMFESLQGLCE